MSRLLGFGFWVLVSMCTAVSAQMPKRDSQQPIEISADTLEVVQESQQAIFSGNVLARQGEMNMKAARMVVYYKGGDSGGGAAAAKGISRIEAQGDVLLTSPEETARAARADYNVDKELVTMTENVVLTRGQNVLKGSQLIYNLATGKSVMNAPGADGGGGRVKGLFVPEKKN